MLCDVSKVNDGTSMLITRRLPFTLQWKLSKHRTNLLLIIDDDVVKGLFGVILRASHEALFLIHVHSTVKYSSNQTSRNKTVDKLCWTKTFMVKVSKKLHD